MKRIQVNAGDKYGNWTVVREIYVNSPRIFLCSCVCGHLREVKLADLTSGKSKSCGCQHPRKGRAPTHGMKRTGEYISWSGMKTRCLNPKATGYERYGGRGITICDRWVNSFEKFYQDMGPRPPGTSIDRLDNDGNYEPDNCMWRTAKAQNDNRRAA